MKRSARAGRELYNPYVALFWEMIDAAAFMVLSQTAVWLFIQIRRQYKNPGGDSHLVLPFNDVKWKLSFQQFKKACKELIDNGFIRVVRKGGLYKQPTVYAMSDDWKARSIEILKDPAAGFLVKRRKCDANGKPVSKWYPKRRELSVAQATRMEKMRAARQTKKLKIAERRGRAENREKIINLKEQDKT